MNNQLQTSDIGNERALKLKEYQSDINLLESLKTKHWSIKNSINRIFSQYIEIGYDLIEIQDKNLLSITEYSSILDYASDQFDLSPTTTSNIMNISKRFSSSRYSLKEEFKDYQFSKLVEMINLPEEQLSLINPDNTVKEIRVIKKLAKLNDRLNEVIGDDSLYGTYHQLIKNYDWFSGIKDPSDVTFESKIIEPKYGKLYSISFKLKSKLHKSANLEFQLNLSSSTISLERNWSYSTITSEQSLLIELESFKNSFKKDIELDSTDKKEFKKKFEPIMIYSIDQMYLGYQYGILTTIISKIFKGLSYYNLSDSKIITDKESVKENDPYLYKIDMSNDGFHIENYDGVVLISMKDIEDLFVKSFDKYIIHEQVPNGQLSIEELEVN